MSRAGTGSVGSGVRSTGASGRFRELLDDFRERHDRAMEEFLADKRRQMPGRGESRELASVLAELVRAGGKRLRPALTYYAYRGSGGRSDEAVLPLALSTELLHTYLLVHDDLMDRSELRRGAPTAHVRFRERYRGNGTSEAAEHFGRSAALLVGDLAHTWAVELFQRVPAEDGRRPALDRTFSSMCEEVISGQYLETVLPHREYESVDEEELLEVLRLKSGRYSMERPAELGVLLAGGTAGEEEPLGVYTRALGEAFQLQDDLLGTFGDASVAGKPGGVDLIEGKLTVLVHDALRSAPPEEARALRRTLDDPSPDRDQIREARSVIRRSGALDRVRTMISERLDRAAAASREAELEGEAGTFFRELVEYLRGRNR